MYDCACSNFFVVMEVVYARLQDYIYVLISIRCGLILFTQENRHERKMRELAKALG